MASRSATQRDFACKTHAQSYPFISPLKLNLRGLHVLVTGAAFEDGVGFAVATAFARAGASRIALIDLHCVNEALTENLKAAAVEAGRVEPVIIVGCVDISQQQSVNTFRKRLSDKLDGRLDILVNNAAHQEPYASFLESDPEQYSRTWDVNVHGLFNMARAFLPMMLPQAAEEQRRNALMINVASSGALSVRAGSSAYRTSKLAILRWTEAIHLEYREQGLTAFCVNPGAIKTQMTVNEPEELRNRLPHKPEIAGDTIAWLASESRTWLGGRYVSCPWDMEELLSRKDEILGADKLKVRMLY